MRRAVGKERDDFAERILKAGPPITSDPKDLAIVHHFFGRRGDVFFRTKAGEVFTWGPFPKPESPTPVEILAQRGFWNRNRSDAYKKLEESAVGDAQRIAIATHMINNPGAGFYSGVFYRAADGTFPAGVPWIFEISQALANPSAYLK